jgi:hypothetical protein
VRTDIQFAPGRLVVRRQFHRGNLLGRAWAATVAQDDERGLCLWIPDGSPYQDVGAADGRTFREVPFGDWPAVPKRMNGFTWRSSVLMVHPAEGDYSVWLFFEPDGAFRNWYVNLERAVVRWDDGDLVSGKRSTTRDDRGPSGSAGVDTLDYDLDIVVAPDRSWAWKDEDEFAEHLAHPDVYWCDDEAAVRAEGNRMVTLIEAGEWPFDGTFTDFRPDPGWPVPSEMLDGWRRPRAW